MSAYYPEGAEDDSRAPWNDDLGEFAEPDPDDERDRHYDDLLDAADLLRDERGM